MPERVFQKTKIQTRRLLNMIPQTRTAKTYLLQSGSRLQHAGVCAKLDTF